MQRIPPRLLPSVSSIRPMGPRAFEANLRSPLPLRAARRKDPLPKGSVPVRGQESPYWNDMIRRLLTATGAASFVDLQNSLQLVTDRHPPGHLPIFYFTRGVTCAGHPGGTKYALQFRYPKAEGDWKTLYLGLECAANMRTLPAKLANSPEVTAATEALAALEHREDALLTRIKREPESADLKRDLTALRKDAAKARGHLAEVWKRDHRTRIISYNEDALVREGSALSDALFSVEIRRARVTARNPEDRAIVEVFAQRLQALKAHAEGIRLDRVYLDVHLVQEFRAIHAALKEQSRALQLWPGLDAAMRTFELYVGSEPNAGAYAEIFKPEELTFIRDQLSSWRTDIENQGPETLAPEAIPRLQTLFRRFEGHGFLTRLGLHRRYPRIQSWMRLLKEDLALLPEELRPTAEFLESFLDAYGKDQVLRPRLPIDKRPRKPVGERQMPKGGFPAAVTEEETPFFREGTQLGRGEKVMRFSSADAARFERLMRYLEENYRSKAAVREEFPQIDEWVENLLRLAPRMREGDAPKTVAQIVTTQEEWRAIERKLTLWQSDESTLFPRHAAQRFQEIAQRRRTRPLRYGQVDGLEALIDRLQFRKKDRSAWLGFVQRHQAWLGEPFVEAFNLVRPLAHSTKETLTLVEIELLRSFDDLLATRFLRLETAQTEEAASLRTLELLLQEPHSFFYGSGSDFTAPEAERTKFLLSRRFVDRATLLQVGRLQYRVRDLGSNVSAMDDLLTRARSSMDEEGPCQLPLPRPGRDLVAQAMQRWEKRGLLSAVQVEQLERAANKDLLFWFEYTVLDMPHRGDAGTEAFQLVGLATDEQRSAMALTVRRHLRALPWPTATLLLSSLLHATESPDARRHMKLTEREEEDRLLQHLTGLQFGYRLGGSFESRQNRAGNIHHWFELASPDSPRVREQFARLVYAALSDIFAKRDGSGFETKIRKRAIDSLAQLREENPEWRSVLFATLSAGLRISEDQAGYKAIRSGCHEALTRLRTTSG